MAFYYYCILLSVPLDFEFGLLVSESEASSSLCFSSSRREKINLTRFDILVGKEIFRLTGLFTVCSALVITKFR